MIAYAAYKFYEAKKNQLPFVTCWGSGSPIREFLHSSDLGDACVYALERWDPASDNAPVDAFDERLNILNSCYEFLGVSKMQSVKFIKSNKTNKVIFPSMYHFLRKSSIGKMKYTGIGKYFCYIHGFEGQRASSLLNHQSSISL